MNILYPNLYNLKFYFIVFLFKVINNERTSAETTTATTSLSTISSSESNTNTTTTTALAPQTIANLTNILFITPSVFTEQIPYNDLENITNIVI